MSISIIKSTISVMAAFALALPAAAQANAGDAKKRKIPPPTIDTDDDGKPDAWDRDANGVPDAWDTDGDGKPDVVDNDGDGRPDGPMPAPTPKDRKPQE